MSSSSKERKTYSFNNKKVFKKERTKILNFTFVYSRDNKFVQVSPPIALTCNYFIFGFTICATQNPCARVQ